MKIAINDEFSEQMESIVAFIAKDNVSAAREFRAELISRLELLLDMPRSCPIYRKNVRKLVFRGYSIFYRIDKDILVVLEIVGANLPKNL